MAVSKGHVDPSFRNLIHFIPEGKKSQQNEEKATQKPGFNQDTKRFGKEAKAFYENLLSESTQTSSTSTLTSVKQSSSLGKNIENTTKNKRKRKASHIKSSQVHGALDGEEHGHDKEFFKSQTLDSNHRQHFKLLGSAQLGCVREVRDLLQLGLNVNFQDFYGWTPLMCAANEGHSPVVKILLESGADRSLQNSTGDNACSIAKNAGHSDVVELISSYKHRHRLEESEDSSSLREETFYCETCKQNFVMKEQKSHYSSTVHLFNRNKKKSLPAFLIPETNRGFQMLLRSGWTGDKGLGPDGKGVKYPVKTILKQDRKGLGGDRDSRKKAKVTHFSAKDERAIQRANTITRRDLSVRTLARNAQKLKDKRERRLEKNLRYEFS